MAQIFVSHSRNDDDIVAFFAKAFAMTNVKAVYKEFEAIKEKVTADIIQSDIEDSEAIFVLLSKNVEEIKHTRDWVVWEAGTGSAKNRDIWIFEPRSQLGKISVVIPHLDHYVIYGINKQWLDYISRIIKSYDDSHILKTLLLTGGLSALGAMLAKEDKAGGAVLGAISGLVLSPPSPEENRPSGVRTKCVKCHSSYRVHIPTDLSAFRCPVCNAVLKYK
jgi:hypothetical protein